MVLYGIQSIIMQEIDPVTKLPPAEGGLEYNLRCAETVDLEVMVEEGEESVLRCGGTGAVLASRRDPDSFYGYDITLTDNEWNAGVFSLINGFDFIPTSASTAEAITTIVTPMISEGMNFKPFRMLLFSAAYEGSDISKYVVFVLNSCTGRVSPISLGQEWSQFEYTINAREATTAGFPVMSVGYFTGTEVPTTMEGITITAGVIQSPFPAARAATNALPKGATPAKVVIENK